MNEETRDKKSNKEKTTEKRCFVIMPFSDQGDYPKGHFQMVYEQIFKPAIIKAGYVPYRVDENKISDSIINKIFEGVQNCEMALCDLSNRNPNVLYELGLRQAYDKPVVLVKDEKTENIFDVSVISTVQYNSNRLYENVVEAQEKICESLKSTGESKNTTLVQFVRAKEASYVDVKVDEDGELNDMLQSIMKELQQIKSSNKTNDIRYIEDSSEIRMIVDNTMNCTLEDVEAVIHYLNSKHNVNAKLSYHDAAKIIIIFSERIYNNKKGTIQRMITENIGAIIQLDKIY